MGKNVKYSFAQNGEDILLWRCFQKDIGFYVDVGASSPVQDSVTQFFYERGWQGVNFEPIPERVDELRRLRPRDATVQAAVSDTVGMMRMFRTAGIGGLSTSSIPAAFADLYKAHSWPISVQTVTLTEHLDALGVAEIDFLKIDAEGAERAVLRSMDFSRWRPSIILVEATKPLSPEPAYVDWEPLLTEASYEFVWFDGLNRYYIPQEASPKLRGHFQTPLNVFDAYVAIGQLGHPLLNTSHPSHSFATHLAHLLLKAVGVETDEYLERIVCLDQPPDVLDRPINASAAVHLYEAVFGSAPASNEIGPLLTTPLPTGRELVRVLLRTDAFRALRVRVAL